jgi:hypothetical protein
MKRVTGDGRRILERTVSPTVVAIAVLHSRVGTSRTRRNALAAFGTDEGSRMIALPTQSGGALQIPDSTQPMLPTFAESAIVVSNALM